MLLYLFWLVRVPLCIEKAIKSLDINLIVKRDFYSTVLKNSWSILNLKNPKDLFTSRRLELSLNLFKQAVETASARSFGKTITLGAPPPHHLRVKTPTVHNQTVSTEYAFHPVYSILTFSLTYLELVITWSEFTGNLLLPGPCNALGKKKKNPISQLICIQVQVWSL